MATEHEVSTDISDQELFKDARGEAPAEPQVQEQIKDTQPRDPLGRYAPKAEEPEAQPEQITPEQPKTEDDRSDVPSWRLREVSEGRRAAEERAAQLERQLEEMRRENTRRQPRPQPQPVEMPDPISDPKGYAAAVRAEIRTEMLRDKVDSSLEEAREQHGEKFDRAFMALESSGDQMLKNRVINAANPGRELMRWFNQQEAFREIGGDIESYRKKLRDEARAEAMKDPDFRKAVMDAMRAEATQQPRPENVAQLPSLAAATGSGASQPDRQPETDREFFKDAIRRRA